MSLDFHLMGRASIFDANITHNLTSMAEEAGIYDCLWRPEENGYIRAGQVAEKLREGIELMRDDPDRFREFDSPNGWGTYDSFMPWLERVLRACEENPDSEIEVSV